MVDWAEDLIRVYDASSCSQFTAHLMRDAEARKGPKDDEKRTEEADDYASATARLHEPRGLCYRLPASPYVIPCHERRTTTSMDRRVTWTR